MNARMREAGSAMIEFLIVAPLLILFTVTLAQFAMLLSAQSVMGYATLMAARAGSTDHADPAAMKRAYELAMVAWYGGGTDTTELAASYARAKRDMAGHLLIQIISPQRDSFTRWNAPALQRGEGQGRRVIPWTGADPAGGGGAYGAQAQTLQQARVLKLRIAQSIAPIDPLFTRLYLQLLRMADPHAGDAAGRFYTGQLAEDRLVVVSTASVHMQTDAVEFDP